MHPGLRPDLSVLLDLPPEVAAQRLRGRDSDRFEREPLAFFERVRAQYLQLAAAEPQRFSLLDASAAPDTVLAAAQAALQPLLGACA